MDLEHIAIILDGNRRWAREKGLPPYIGHKIAVENLEELAKELNKTNLKYLTVFVFSTENWKREKKEVDYLLQLFRVYFRKITKSKDNDFKINFLGSKENLDEKYIKMIKEAEETTKNNKGLELNICFNYGGRKEITEAIKDILKDIEAGKIKREEISETLVSDYLYSKNIPDPEIIIRTSGEMRLSNFLLWQNAYSELFFVEKYWPDFKIQDLNEIKEEFQNRDRRFGGK